MLPKTLNLGSGKDWRDDYFNADIQKRTNPDWHVDITKVKWGAEIATRFGSVKIVPDLFEKIEANDVLEHIPDLVTAMTNCKDLLKTGGEFHIKVPYDLSLGAWQDPTHVRAFNENSFLYYTDWHWYLGWEDRFELIKMEFGISEYGQTIENTEQLLRTPRAIDFIKVILKKS